MGFIYVLKKTIFGLALPEENQLFKTFLRDDRFVVYDLSLFNGLGLGLTQLHNKRIVFNRKRHGKFQFNGKIYSFHRWRSSPKKLSKEFLYVEFMNRFNKLAENKEKSLQLLRKQLKKLNRKKLLQAVNNYGKKSTKKKLQIILTG